MEWKNLAALLIHPGENKSELSEVRKRGVPSNYIITKPVNDFSGYIFLITLYSNLIYGIIEKPKFLFFYLHIVVIKYI